MAIHIQCYTNISKQKRLLDGNNIGSVPEGMNDISNVKVQFKTHSGNVNI